MAQSEKQAEKTNTYDGTSTISAKEAMIKALIKTLEKLGYKPLYCEVNFETLFQQYDADLKTMANPDPLNMDWKTPSQIQENLIEKLRGILLRS